MLRALIIYAVFFLFVVHALKRKDMVELRTAGFFAGIIYYWPCVETTLENHDISSFHRFVCVLFWMFPGILMFLLLPLWLAFCNMMRQKLARAVEYVMSYFDW